MYLYVICLLFLSGHIYAQGTTKPMPFDDDRSKLAKWLLYAGDKSKYKSDGYEYPGYDGFYNNLARPDSGAIDKPLLRRAPNAYKDGVYEPSGYDRPNPLDISENVLKGEIGTHSYTGKNAFLVFFGQQVVEEILDAQRPACPPEYFNIDIPLNHTYRKDKPHHTMLPLLRTRYDQRTGFSPNNPRQQLNEITPYIDGGLFYGITKQWSDQLRTNSDGKINRDGTLASQHNGDFPATNKERLPLANPPPPFYHEKYIKEHKTAPVDRFFKLGNPRGNENAFLLTFGVLWFRWHNFLAKQLYTDFPEWSSEKIYNEARKWTIATQQYIYIYQWLPKWIQGGLKDMPYKYDPSVDPQIDQFFQSAAFRFGHTLVTPGVYLRDYANKSCNTKFEKWGKNAVRTCNIFWRPQEPMQAEDNDKNIINIDRLIMGMSTQLCEREDHKIVEDLRGNVFGPLEFPRRDLMAVNIQRGRDHGLPDFNSARKAFNLKPYTSFDEFNNSNVTINQTVINWLKENYKDINKVDVWVGGILETTKIGPGELFSTIIKDQFNRIRNADRFWFENYEMNNLFTKEEVDRIKQLTVHDIVVAVTQIKHDDVPRDIFRVPVETDATLLSSCKFEKYDSEQDNKTYYHLPLLNQITLNESCLQGDSYDYFKNSEVSFILTFSAVGVFIIGVLSVAYLFIQFKNKKAAECNTQINKMARETILFHDKSSTDVVVAQEWVDSSTMKRIVIKVEKSQIKVQNHDGTLLRAIDFKKGDPIKLIYVNDEPTLIIQCPHNYDLVLKLESLYIRDLVEQKLENFVTANELQREKITSYRWKAAEKIIITKENRQKKLEMFFRVVFAQAFKIEHSSKELLKVDSTIAKDIVNTELTQQEFADSLKMKPTDEFLKKLFQLTDKDKNGFISYREFVDLLIIFAKGDQNEKAFLIFKMYDINDTGFLTKGDFVEMIKSFLDIVGGNVSDRDLQHTVESMLREARVDTKISLSFDDFKNIIGKEINVLNTAKLGFSGIPNIDRRSYLQIAKDEIESIYQRPDEIQNRFQGRIAENNKDSRIIDDDQDKIIKSENNHQVVKNWKLFKYIELKSKQIFWLTLYTLILLAIFAERAYYYSVEREDSGLRRIAGYGVTVTRGAASAMMFTYSSLFVTMCRNSITFLRDTVANNYFPFDSIVEIHKYIAYWALVFTVIHVIGHAVNFYHISTQTADDLTCLFRNFFHATHELPKFHYWCWQTMTGFTGVVLTLICITMYIFAMQVIRRKLYNWFWYTHNLYPLFYIFMILHGTGRLIQAPITYYFLLGPAIWFTIDSIKSISRKKIEIKLAEGEVLPSNVTKLKFRKPPNFQYKSGQWVRIACLSLNQNEYHPFTLSSCPQEEYLTLHIRAVGPWTTHIRSLIENNLPNTELPKIYLDGPYGEGHQDWSSYDVSILIGGGIGVTPFASILKDIAYGYGTTTCKKVYFIWVSRTQKQFEWMVDIIREVENNDKRNLVSCHIFITQFYEKFDLRTIMLYICEKHYQRVSNKSLFTNLNAVTHFGRPVFDKFFKTVQQLNPNAKSIGVLSCGPPTLTKAVEKACWQINQIGDQKFEHHYKNF